MPRPRINEDILEQLLRLRRTKSIRRTAELLDISTATVNRYCGKAVAAVLRRWTPPPDSRRRTGIDDFDPPGPFAKRK